MVHRFHVVRADSSGNAAGMFVAGETPMMSEVAVGLVMAEVVHDKHPDGDETAVVGALLNVLGKVHTFAMAILLVDVVYRHAVSHIGDHMDFGVALEVMTTNVSKL